MGDVNTDEASIVKTRQIFKSARDDKKAPITHHNICNTFTSTATHYYNHRPQTEPVPEEMAAMLRPNN